MKKQRSYVNYEMNELLKKAEPYGMTAEHLKIWQPADHCEYAEFTRFHKYAAMHLMRDHHYSALNAIVEISGLSRDEAVQLKTLHSFGINGKFIREHHHEYSFESMHLTETLKYLMREFKLSREAGLQEMKDLQPMEIQALKLFYKSGLRRENLIAFRSGDLRDANNKYQPINKSARHHKKLYYFLGDGDDIFQAFGRERKNYLVRVIHAEIKAGATWEAALSRASAEAHQIRDNYPSGRDERAWCSPCGATSQRVHFLNRHVSDGVRANEVPQIFDHDRRAMYNVLRVVHRLPVHNALREISGLSDEQIKLMRKYHKEGVNRRILLSYPHSLQMTNQMIEHLQMKPLDVILQLSSLTHTQGLCLGEFAAKGLTLKQAKMLMPEGDFSKLKRDIAVTLVDNGGNPFDVLNNVLPKSDQDAVALLKEPLEFKNMVSMKI